MQICFQRLFVENIVETRQQSSLDQNRKIDINSMFYNAGSLIKLGFVKRAHTILIHARDFQSLPIAMQRTYII